MTAEEVKTLQIGEKVNLCGMDEAGNPRNVECTVAYRSLPAQKILTYREGGKLRHCAIKDYPGKNYERPEGK